jgi:hypothetical protein
MQVSVNGGRGPAWNPRGNELFYQTRTALMSVPFRNRQPSRPVRLFAPAWSEEYRREFDVTPDGGRFLFVQPSTGQNEITLVKNWFREVTAKVPPD